MPASDDWPVGVCVLPEPAPNLPRTVAYPDYVEEILAHAGLGYTRAGAGDPGAGVEGRPRGRGRRRLLTTGADRRVPGGVAPRLHEWVEAGGGWLSVGGVCSMENTIGARLAPGYRGWGGGTPTLG